MTSQSGARRATSRAKRSSRRLSNGAGAPAGKMGSPVCERDVREPARGARRRRGARSARTRRGGGAARRARARRAGCGGTARTAPRSRASVAPPSGGSATAQSRPRSFARRTMGRTPPSTRARRGEARISTACAIARLVRRAASAAVGSGSGGAHDPLAGEVGEQRLHAAPPASRPKRAAVSATIARPGASLAAAAPNRRRATARGGARERPLSAPPAGRASAPRRARAATGAAARGWRRAA